MAASTYKLTEIIGTSTKSFADATQNAVKRAGKTLRHLSWFEVREMRGRIADAKVEEYQVRLAVGFKLDD